jgi:hypothetical protein
VDGCPPRGETAGVALLAPDQPGDSHVDTLFARAGSTLAGDQSLDLHQQGAQFGFINIDLGAAGESDLERKLLAQVGSYGRQLGRIGDALKVILKHVKLGDLKPEEKDALDILKGQLAAVRQIKAERRASTQAAASGETQSRAR